MTKFRRALLAILSLVGITAGSLAVGDIATAVVPPSSVVITISKSCLADGWQVDYTANSVDSALPWKNMTVGWLPTINTYQANTIPFTRSTGVLPFSQPTTPSISINVEWTDESSASDTADVLSQPDCEVAPTTTTPPSDTIVVDLTNPPTSAPAATDPGTIAPEPPDTNAGVDASDTTAVTEFPVTGSDNGGLLVGGFLVGGGVIALLATRRKPKHA